MIKKIESEMLISISLIFFFKLIIYIYHAFDFLLTCPHSACHFPCGSSLSKYTL